MVSPQGAHNRDHRHAQEATRSWVPNAHSSLAILPRKASVDPSHTLPSFCLTSLLCLAWWGHCSIKHTKEAPDHSYSECPSQTRGPPVLFRKSGSRLGIHSQVGSWHGGVGYSQVSSSTMEPLFLSALPSHSCIWCLPGRCRAFLASCLSLPAIP